MAGVLQYALDLDTGAMTSALASAQSSLAAAQAQMERVGKTGDRTFDGTTKGSRAASAGLKDAAASAQSLTSKLSSAGATAANIWAGAKAVGEAWKATTKFFQNGGVAAALTKVKSGLKAIASDPAMRRVAIGAAAATTAIAGTYAALRTLRAARGGMMTVTKSLRSIGSAATTATSKVTGLVGKLTGIGSVLAGVSAGALALSALSKAADMESLNVSMEVLIGNVEESKRVMGELKDFANVTPFSTREVMESGKNLIALGSDTKTLTAELRALGDVSAGMSIPLKEMVEIYGKARTQGTLYAEDLNQLAGRGVPIFKELARVLGVNESAIKKMASEGQITFPMLQKVFSDLTSEGGKFFGMMEKQSGTTKGLLSTLKSELDNLLIAIGTPINDFLKPIIAANIGRMQALNQRVAAFLTLLGEARKQGKMGEFLGAGLKLALIDGINIFSAGIRGSIAYLAASVPPIFQTAMEILTSDRTKVFFTSLFRGVAGLLEAGILRGVAKQPGMDEMTKVADAAKAGADMNFKLAEKALSGADFEGTIDKMGKALVEAHQKGAAAFTEAGRNPLIDRNPALEGLKKIGNVLNPEAIKKLLNPPVLQVAKQTESLEKSLGGLDTAIKKNTPKKPAATTQQAPGPAMAEDGEPARRPGILSAAQTALKKLQSGSRLSLMETRALRSGTRGRPLRSDGQGLGGRLINPERAAERLARGNAAVRPGQARRMARQEEAMKANDPLYRAVKAIEEKFDNLVTA